ncbi:MAG: glyoxylate/hydroxypyruvate reductase A [Granulosicoccus sp.]|nr:glyoxylate/hydroxypyruvate reductase A [Granulosicoccus sp.]
MSILFYCENDDDRLIEQGLSKKLPDEQLHAYPHCPNPAAIEYAVVWQPPADFFDGLTGLKAIFSLAAGVDHLLNHPSLPQDVPLVRLQDAGMGEKMAEYVLYGVLHAQRRMTEYALHQRAEQWAHDPVGFDAGDCRVGILGLGTLGQIVARRLLDNGYAVSGWSRTEKKMDGVDCFHGSSGQHTVVSSADVLVCLLPLTDMTRGVLNQALFRQCKPGVFIINLARGGHLVQDDLIASLDEGQVSGALLDVTDPEPLPAGNPLWQHPRVIITPHVAGPTQEKESIDQVAANIKRHRQGESMSGIVDRSSGY